MAPTLSQIQEHIDVLAPPDLAEDWDNAGLQVGRSDWPVEKIWVALDPAPDVVADACRNHIDLLVCHHPLILKPIKSIEFGRVPGSIVYMAARHHLAIYSAHTNLDSVQDGLNDIFAKRIGLKNIRPLMPSATGDGEPDAQGIGRIGDLEPAMALTVLAKKIKKQLSLRQLRIAGTLDLPVDKVAVCTGSGSGVLGRFFNSDAQVFVSGDLKYHDARDAEWSRRALIDVGHFASEHLMVEALSDRLAARLAADGLDVSVEACTLENDPFHGI